MVQKEMSAVIHYMIEEQARRAPERTAVIFEESVTTYGELERMAEQIAATLRAELGATNSNRVVGLLLDRGPELLAGLLGILKAGAAYVPIDPDFPPDRIQYMLDDSQAPILLTQHRIVKHLRFAGKVVDVEAALTQPVPPAANALTGSSELEIAYIIYTSGSTGKPKGVMIEHQSLGQFVQEVTRIIDFTAEKTILALTTVSFDIFALETLLPLTRGMSIVMAGKEEQTNPRQLRQLIQRNHVDMLQVTPSRMRQLLSDRESSQCLEGLQDIMMGGEALPQHVLKQVRNLTGAKLYNLYGPTETTIWSAIQDVTEAETVNIGKPIANTRMYIVDESGHLVPDGTVGELCIAGGGLARGYWKRPELTAEKFVEATFDKLERIYKTGDMARRLDDGAIEVLGRKDRQVKVRGHRIELEEIEHTLLKHPAIRMAAVLTKPDHEGFDSLHAFCVIDADVDTQGLRVFLHNELPAYMVPNQIHFVEHLPLTPNGKLDVQSLAATLLSVKGPSSASSNMSATEKQVAEIWRTVLGTEQSDIERHLFEAGGDSISIVGIYGKLDLLFPGWIRISDLFSFPTIRSFSSLLDTKLATKIDQVKTSTSMPDIGVRNARHLPPTRILKSEFTRDMSALLESALSYLGIEFMELCIAVFAKMQFEHMNCSSVSVCRVRNKVLQRLTLTIPEHTKPSTLFDDILCLSRVAPDSQSMDKTPDFDSGIRIPLFTDCEAYPVREGVDWIICVFSNPDKATMVWQFNDRKWNEDKMEHRMRQYLQMIMATVRHANNSDTGGDFDE